MSIRGYGAMTTGVIGAIFSFDMIWNLTNMEALHGAFMALLIGFAMAGAFMFLTEPKETKAATPASRFYTDDSTGLSVLIQRGRV